MEEGKKWIEEREKAGETGGKVVEIEFSELGKDPMGVVRRVYEMGGWDLEKETEKKMIEFIHNKFHEVGEREMARARVVGWGEGVEEFGLREEEVDEIMGAYVEKRGYKEKRREREEREREWVGKMERDERGENWVQIPKYRNKNSISKVYLFL